MAIASLLSWLLYSITLLFTALYALLAYVPFTYQQVIQSELIAGMNKLVGLHPYIFATSSLLMAIFFIEKSTRKIFLAIHIPLCFYFTIFPILKNLRNDESSLYLSIALLSLLISTHFFDLRKVFVTRKEELSLSLEKQFLGADWAAFLSIGVCLALISTSFYSLQHGSKNLILGNLFILACSYVFTRLTRVLAQWAPTPPVASFLMEKILVAMVLACLFVTWVIPSLSLQGPTGYVMATLLGISIAASFAIVRIRFDKHPTQPLLLSAAFFVGGMIALTQWLPGMDWNFLMQKLLSTLLCLFAYQSCRWALGSVAVPRDLINPRFRHLLAVVGVASFFSFSDTTPALGSAKVFADFLPNSKNNEHQSGETFNFYKFLQANTNLPLSVKIKQVDLQTVEETRTEKKFRPHIFIFVIDSLRRDYLGAYNEKVKFTPQLDLFAQESIVFKNALTRYGATGLSQPSIWAGSMLAHQQYPQPFHPFNSLEKLLIAEGYDQQVSRDSILSSILKNGTNDLDQGVSTQDLNLCTTIEELKQRLNQRSSNDGPVFVYSQPQNIHISVLAKQKGGGSGQSIFESFYEPYAKRLQELDKCFGTFVSFLKEKKLFDESVVIFTSDHGDSLGEGDRFGHAYTIFPEILKIPLLVHLPSTYQDKAALITPNELTFSTDITPSLYDLLGHSFKEYSHFTGRAWSKTDPATPRPDSYLVASSYGPVYGLVNPKNNSIFIADAVNLTESYLELSSGKDIEMSDTEKISHRSKIKSMIGDLHSFYGFNSDN